MHEIGSLQLSNGITHEYRIIPSKRAKYLRIKLSNMGELTVTLPLNVPSSQAHKFIKTKRLWIEKHISDLPLDKINSIPEKIDLMLLNEVWSLELTQTLLKSISLEEHPDYCISLVGNTNNYDLVCKVLDLWYKNKCRAVFASMLEELAEKHGFHYNRLSIRAQKTRWGSCSSRKNINLNCKLILMPKEVIEYVMIHELCHTIEMNHSVRFWALVEECDPNYKKNKSILKERAKSLAL